MSNLSIYKASAGSGKTFTLAIEYIKLLLQNPRAYEGILAVTFTNKATEEMKMRILSTLYALWQQHPEAKPYLTELMKEPGAKREDIERKAHQALILLLHNYHNFRISTIDTFFQLVLRNLARELQLNASLRVGLNNKQVVDMAVDEMVDSIADDKKLMKIVMDYVEDNIRDNKQWNVIRQIKAFGGTIFQELYKQNRKRMQEVFSSPKFFEQYKQQLWKIVTSYQDKYTTLGKQAVKLIEKSNLSIDSFNYGASGTANYFYKLSNGILTSDKLLTTRVVKGMDDVSIWVKKKSPDRATVEQLVTDTLQPMLVKIEEERPKEERLSSSARMTLRHINDIRLLKHIEDTAHTINEAAQRFMLSDTQNLLHEIIDNSDSPFIYEKTGAHLEHIMIDEFQDTSTIQWENFKLLLKECMSQGQGNLIVGDVKQSIYRFRSGDWRLLNNIDKEFSEEEISFSPRKTNYRSTRNIIDFNNTFLSLVADEERNNIAAVSEAEAANLEKAYSDVKQEIPEGKPQEGLVCIEMLPKEEIDSIPEKTLQIIRDLIDRGMQQSDIAILVRGKKEIATIADYIEANSDLTVMSAEAFTLESSSVLQTIIHAMKFISRPNDELTKAVLSKYCGGTIPQAFIDSVNKLQSMSLHDMVEEIIKVLSLDHVSGQSAYVTTFFDHLSNFCSDTAPVLEDFLTAWEEDICEKTIETPECDGIRILTIHKSKGLEFDHVILPYCNWNYFSHSSTIWAQPKVEPFSQLPMVALDFKGLSSLKDTIYEEDGNNEYIQCIVDNLNLLYVAMTRASKSLFIIGENTTSDSNRATSICKAIQNLPAEINGLPVHVEGTEGETLTVTFGTLTKAKTKTNEATAEKTTSKSSNPFINIPISEPVLVTAFEKTATFRQSNDSLRFVDDNYDESDRQRMIKKGTVLHQLFSNISTTADIERELQNMEFDGKLYDDDITRESLMESLRQKFAAPQIQDWFSDRWTLYNECTIVTKDGEQRPDRVMTNGKETIVVDFKFGAPHRGYAEQVQNYVQLLREMGMPNVKGYLWYVNRNQVVPSQES